MSKFIVLKELIRGKSLGRILQNLEFSHLTLFGKVIDLGSKTDSSSYYRFVKKDVGTELLFTDKYENNNIVNLDLEKPYPIENNKYDFVILNNVLEHLFEYQKCSNEIFRILKEGGTLLGSVPFIHKIHHDPDDFFRYTDSSLKKIFQISGFETIEIKALALGPFSTASALIAPLLKVKLFSIFLIILSIGIDNIINSLCSKKLIKQFYPLSYFFICKKGM